ncbi:MAG: flagellar hook-length control protein FliK, partial [Solirubrobacteraceae bacterium]
GEQPAGEQPAPTSATAAPAMPSASSVAQPAAQPTAAPAQPSAAPLHQAPRAVAQLLHVAVDRGITHAKLNLRPVELGGIEIRLQTSAAGVTAQVIADSPEAAKLLQQAADELRRSLERSDVTLLSLDIATAGEHRFDGSAGASADLAEEQARHHARHGGDPAAAAADEQSPVTATVQLPSGLLVDVLA